MARLKLTNESWTRLIPTLSECGIYKKRSLRNTIEGIFWRIRTGAPWRDLPGDFGPWKTVYNQFNRWSLTGKIASLLSKVKTELDTEWIFPDSTSVKVHQHAMGARGSFDQAIGVSRGGKTTKVHLCVDAMGNPIAPILTGGQFHDSKIAPELFEAASSGCVISADKAYHSKKLAVLANQKQARLNIPPKKGYSPLPGVFDKHLYIYRHLVENFFCYIKQYRAVATRYDKLKRNYMAVIELVCLLWWLPLS